MYIDVSVTEESAKTQSNINRLNVTKRQSTIAINGRSYDANNGTAIDIPVKIISPTVVAEAPAVEVMPERKSSAHPKNHLRRHAEHSSTLMRHAVKKPVVSKTVRRSGAIEVKHVVEKVDSRRLQHAEAVAKSHHI